MDKRPICPAVVPNEEPAPLPGIAILIGLLVGGLAALVCAGLSIAGGVGVILGAFS